MNVADRVAFCGALVMVLTSAASTFLASDRTDGAGPCAVANDPALDGSEGGSPSGRHHDRENPERPDREGTSFYVGNDLWMSARHVLNDQCANIIMIVDSKNVAAQLKYNDDSAELVVVRAEVPEVPALPLETEEMREDDAAYAYGFPQGILGGTAGTYLGRTWLKFGGF